MAQNGVEMQDISAEVAGNVNGDVGNSNGNQHHHHQNGHQNGHHHHVHSEEGSVVDVNAAVAEFKKLEDDILIAQRKADIEAQGGAAGEWDIHEFFEESVRKGEETGHKLKRMGVIVKNLTVVGMGADADRIPDNMDIFKALWIPNWYVSLSLSLSLSLFLSGEKSRSLSTILFPAS